jgi:6-pyruvoyltetrahydropterin/6-carboxytetrahydropterin synthase
MYGIEVNQTIDAGHRVVGHEGKCRFLHGHTYAVKVEIATNHLQEEIGFVIDFGVVKDLIKEWDHRLLLWEEDPVRIHEYTSETYNNGAHVCRDGEDDYGVVRLPFNPTAENMASYLANEIKGMLKWPQFVSVEVSETPTTVARFVIE